MNVHRAVRRLLAQATLASALIALHAGASHAQWVQTNGPKEGSVSSLAAVPNAAGGTRLFAGQIYVWHTDDNGATWSRESSGLTNPNAFVLIGVPNGSGGNDLFIGTNAGVFRSTDEGANWSPINNGITNTSIYALASGPNGSGGTNVYAGAFQGNAYRSTDNGASWTAIQSGLPLGYDVQELITTGAGTLLAGTTNGIYRSSNFGASWTQVMSNRYAFSFAKNGTTLYAGTSSGVWTSVNDGVTWTPINAGMQFSWVYAVAAIPNGSGVTLFAGAMRSTDNGQTWAPAANGMTNLAVWALTTAPNASGGTDLYAGTGDGVFRTSNYGDSWTNASFVASYIRAVEVAPSGTILAGTDMDIYRSGDGGATWTDNNSQARAQDFAINLDGASGVSLFVGGIYTGVQKSIDDGMTWNDSNNGIDVPDLEVNSIAVIPNGAGGSNILTGTYDGIFRSTNDGALWQSVDPIAMPLDFIAVPNGSGGDNIFAGGFNGVWKSTNYGQTWGTSGLGVVVQELASTANGANVFAASDVFGVYRSTDGGATWALVNDGLSDLSIVALLSPDGANLFAAGAGGVFLSTNHGASWSSVSDGLTSGGPSLALSPDGSTLIAGTAGFGVWKRPISEMIQTAVGVSASSAPAGIVLQANQPNPFSAGTTIQYRLVKQTPVRLVVYDMAGRTVRTLVDGVESAGERRTTWDGRDESGSPASAGMYVYRLDAGGVSLTRKMSLLR